MEIRRNNSFIEDYRKLTVLLRKQVIKQLALLEQNPRHSSLRIKKIQGADGIFEGRVTRSCRFTFHFEERVLVLRRVEEHDKTLNNP